MGHLLNYININHEVIQRASIATPETKRLLGINKTEVIKAQIENHERIKTLREAGKSTEGAEVTETSVLSILAKIPVEGEPPVDENEINELVSFLHSLTGKSKNDRPLGKPISVPSGIKVD